MPRGDKTGPAGMGPMTGRAAGYCAGYPTPGFVSSAAGYGYWGRGRGRGWRHWYRATGMPGWARIPMGYPGLLYPFMPRPGQFASTVTAEQELDALKKQAEFFQDELGQINERIKQLEVETPK